VCESSLLQQLQIKARRSRLGDQCGGIWRPNKPKRGELGRARTSAKHPALLKVVESIPTRAPRQARNDQMKFETNGRWASVGNGITEHGATRPEYLPPLDCQTLTISNAYAPFPCAATIQDHAAIRQPEQSRPTTPFTLPPYLAPSSKRCNSARLLFPTCGTADAVSRRGFTRHQLFLQRWRTA
jgi:hypothetical protein